MTMKSRRKFKYLGWSVCENKDGTAMWLSHGTVIYVFVMPTSTAAQLGKLKMTDDTEIPVEWFKEIFSTWEFNWDVPALNHIDRDLLAKNGAIRFKNKTMNIVVVSTQRYMNILISRNCPYPIWTLAELARADKLCRTDFDNVVELKRRFHATLK